MLPKRYSIGAKIFGAFVAMSLLIAAIGLGGYFGLRSIGEIAVTTFDGPLMAISYARAAHGDFAEMQMAELRYEAGQGHDRAALKTELSELASSFDDDLQVTTQRATAADEQGLILQIRPLVQQWRLADARGDLATLQRLDSKIDAKFDLLIELITDHGFVSRRQTVESVGYYKYASVTMTVFALLLAAGLTMLLKSRLVRPLGAAAAVADRIARGELQTQIPASGDDETGALLRSMTVMQDNIRDMMGREQQLRRSAENRLAEALETSYEGVILVGPDGQIILANSSLHKFFPMISDSIVPGLQFETAIRLIRSQLKPSEDAVEIGLSGDVELELADGRWLRLAASRTSEGGSILLLSDFTAIKEREEKLRVAMREAEAANAAKSRFLANMSHELRTPLNAIIGFSEILSGQLFGPLGDERYWDYSQDILRSGKHLLAVINDVLDLSKSDAGKLGLNVQPIDLRDVLGDCLSMVRDPCAESDLSITTKGLEQCLPMEGDAAKLRQIFLNLLSNAIKFTERGGKISLGVVAMANEITVSIADTGIGMNADDLHIALQPFGQVDNRLERRYEGAGLGLPLAKALVDLHGGTLKIASARGLGTCVSIRLARSLKSQLPLAG